MEKIERATEQPNPTHSGRYIGLRVLYFLLGLAFGVVLTFLILIIIAAVYGVSY